ncbi:hypothetical protein N0V90_008393 [Kalmusia sp. IMI 367209]|nr:hypothetical protein N0V90_008393 [Kalmusia sp. IMI 367209]
MSISRELQKQQPDQQDLSLLSEHRSRFDSASTLSEDDLHIIYTPESSRSDLQDPPEWLTQLNQFASHDDSSGETSLKFFKASPPLDGYIRESTDFLVDDEETPCPKRTFRTSFQDSTRSISKRKQKNNGSAIRRLNFRVSSTKKTPKQSPSKRRPTRKKRVSA